ncbi:MAG: acetylxylan esterase, partial [Clostridia bacterium]|nr:acetylxylan esterase [Clostridia bacterium]
LLDVLLYEEYGTLPAAPDLVSATVEQHDKNYCAGKAELFKLRLHCQAAWGEFSFPVYYTRLTRETSPVPAFIHINFRDANPDRYQPTEELVDEGYATLTFCYLDVSSDDGDFTNGLAGVIYPDGKRAAHQCGKIGLWAWAARAVMDYAVTLPELDASRISVAGHSRLGKTALLAGALDERFFCAFSNDSGCCGAALSRGNTGETVKKITDRFPYWFCEHYLQYADREDELPFDQHCLIAANLPHRVYVASAAEDLWACPPNEYRSCVAASAYYEADGGVGFVHPNRLPEVGECLHEGRIGYHLRGGTHYFSCEDWRYYIQYLRGQEGK